MIIKNEKDLAIMKEIGQICAYTLQETINHMEPGMTTKELDEFAGRLLEKNGAISAPMAVYDFPGYTCISVNEEVAHGIPGDRVLKEGDLVNVDVSAHRDGYYGDNGRSVVLGKGNPLGRKLCVAAADSLAKSIAQAKAGRPLSLVSKASEDTAKKHGFKTVRNLCGHGVGRTLHDDPDTIYGYFDPRDHRILKHGTVIAIEPFVTSGDILVVEDKHDGWTLRTPHHSLVAQCEHTICVWEDKPIILTTIK